MNINNLIKKLEYYRDEEGVSEVVFKDEYNKEHRELDFRIIFKDKTTLELS